MAVLESQQAEVTQKKGILPAVNGYAIEWNSSMKVIAPS
jgi:hypothetical protein